MAEMTTTKARPEAGRGIEPCAFALDPSRLVEAYADTILRVSYTYLHSTADAEDICQDIFLKMLEQPRAFRSPEHERAWVIRATINLCKDRLRRRATHPEVALESVAEPEAARTTAEPEARARETRVLEAVQALPEAMRIAIYLHYYEGYTIHGIALLAQRSEAAVAQSLSRGRKKLRETLKGDDDVFDFN